MPVPILTYHAMRIHGNAVEDNDLVSLTHDLEALARAGYRVAPVREIVDRWLEDPEALARERVAGITCDDGGDFDFHDLEHPTWGLQRSFHNRLLDAAARGLPAHGTTFVIVSPEARRELDRTCMVGRGWWNDDWWPVATQGGCMHVGSHSWDHNHDFLPESFSHGVPTGTFAPIATFELAELEVRQAQEFLARHAPNPGSALFAYPYGDASPYLVDEYLPRHGPGMGLVAALGGDPEPLTRASHRWNLPRFIHGRDWNTPAELESLLGRL